MKKFISIILSLSMLLCVAAMLASCDKDGDAASTTTVATTPATTTVVTTTVATTAPIPDGYKLFANDDISFVYPDDWSKTDGSIVLLAHSTGNPNITVSSEELTDDYHTMTIQEFEEQVGAGYEQAGMALSNVTAETKTVNGLSVRIFEFNTEIISSGVDFVQSAYIFNVGEKTYSLALTEITADSDLRAAFLNSIKAVD